MKTLEDLLEAFQDRTLEDTEDPETVAGWLLVQDWPDIDSAREAASQWVGPRAIEVEVILLEVEPTPQTDVVDSAEIARRLDVKRKTVHAWRDRDLGFPEPMKTLDVGPVWDWLDVWVWAMKTGRR